MERILKFVDDRIANEFDYGGLGVLKRIAVRPEVANPVVALPDFHVKANMEAPSSIAVGVSGHIMPHLTSCSLNCGMGAVATDLALNKSFLKDIGRFYAKFRDEKVNKKYDLAKNDLYEVLHKGPRALQEKYEFDSQIIESFELQGNMVDANDYSVEDCVRLIPNDLLSHPKYNGLTELGTGLAGNHFLEIQSVAEIYDKEVCRSNNIKETGQIVIMYHGGGGIIPGFLGGYFARRLKGYDGNMKLIFNKIRYHLPSMNSFSAFLRAYKYYFSSRRFIAIPEQSPEGKRLVFANNVAMNYGYAYRMFMILRIRDALRSVFGRLGEKISLFKDISHNSIQKEKYNGEELWVHRHNACRIQKGILTLLPGYNNTNSYLCAGGNNTRASMNTVPHGAGDSIKAYKKCGILQKLDKKCTMIYRGDRNSPEIVNHFSDEGITAVIKRLEKERIMRPVARLTPIAVLKDFS